MVVDFALPSPGQGLLDALQMWDNKSTRANCDYSFHMAVTWWGEQVFNEMETVVREKGINTFKHFMAYKGALMVNDDEMFASFSRCAELGALPLVHAENGDVVATMQQKLMAEGNIHVYSKLRGRALAGVRGDGSARIFCQQLNAELVSIAGHYRVAEDLPEAHRNRAVYLSLEGDAMQFTALS